jgi:hypothetical protein
MRSIPSPHSQNPDHVSSINAMQFLSLPRSLGPSGSHLFVCRHAMQGSESRVFGPNPLPEAQLSSSSQFVNPSELIRIGSSKMNSESRVSGPKPLPEAQSSSSSQFVNPLESIGMGSSKVKE